MDKEINFKSEGESRYWFDQEFKFCFQRFTEKQTALLFFLQPQELFRPLPPLFEQEKNKDGRVSLGVLDTTNAET